jgi:uncharacterized protein YdhG (YjbR/CyaY superfamily)
MTSKRPAAKPKTPDEYLAAVSPEKRAALEKLRKTIRSAAPGAQEGISYGLPAFLVDGRFLVAYGAATHHYAFYPGGIAERFADELEGYSFSKGAIRFQPDRPIPAALVRKMVKARLARL